MEQYVVRTPKNPEYTGKSVGVFFRNGEGFVNDYTIDKRMGLTVREVAQRMGELGYEVTEVLGEQTPLMVQPEKAAEVQRAQAKEVSEKQKAQKQKESDAVPPVEHPTNVRKVTKQEPIPEPEPKQPSKRAAE